MNFISYEKHYKTQSMPNIVKTILSAKVNFDVLLLYNFFFKNEHASERSTDA